MKKHWVLTPYNSSEPEIFDRAWKYDMEHGTLAIGWHDLGDVISLNKDSLDKKFSNVYPNDSLRGSNTVWRFCHEIEVGDVVLVRRGLKNLVGIGEVTRSAYYDPDKGTKRVGNTKHIYPNFIDVRLRETNKLFDDIIFSMNTLYSISEERFNSITSDDLTRKTPLVEDGVPVVNQHEFLLEKYLQEFIVDNFKKIFFNELEICSESGASGKYNADDAGEIDILAREPKTGAYVVIELKKGRESDKVVGQVLRYIGWVREKLAKNGEAVKGIIILKKKDIKMDYALKAIPNVSIQVKRYEVDFKLHD